MVTSANHILIRCPSCNGKLRVRLPFQADKRSRCPTCVKVLPSKALILASPQHKLVALLCVFFLVVGLLPFAWPAGFYLIAGLTLLYAFTWLKVGSEVRGWAGSRRFFRLLGFNSTKGLQDALLWISLGILIVCIAQLLLRASFVVVSEATIGSIEDGIARAQFFLSQHLKLKWLIGALAVWLVLRMLWPSRISMERFHASRRWVSRVLVVLTVFTSFSFFSAVTVKSLERGWVAGRKEEFRQSVERIKNTRRQLVIDAYLRKQIESLPLESKFSLRDYFSDSYYAPSREERIQDLARSLLDKEPPVETVSNDFPDSEAPAGNATSSPREPTPPGLGPNEGRALEIDFGTEESIGRIAEWANAPDSNSVPPPSLMDGRRAWLEAERGKSLLDASRTVVEEALKTALGDSLHSVASEPLIKLLVKSLQGSVVKTAVAKVLPRGVNSAAAALSWVRKNVSPGGGRAEWDWKIAKRMLPEPLPGSSAQFPLKTLPETTRFGNKFEDPFKVLRRPHIDFLIEHLSCSKETLRLEVARTLNRLGPSLEKSEVQRIERLLSNNEGRFRISPDKQLYDTAPVSYYAAKALSGMNSPHLTGAMQLNARGLISQFDTPHYTQRTNTSILKAASV